MALIKSFIGVISIATLIIANSPKEQARPVTIEGKVTSKETGKPLENVYVYTVEGEEEALTKADGQFKLITWQQLPVLLQVQHKDYKKESIRITAPVKPLTIPLERQDLGN